MTGIFQDMLFKKWSVHMFFLIVFNDRHNQLSMRSKRNGKFNYLKYCITKFWRPIYERRVNLIKAKTTTTKYNSILFFNNSQNKIYLQNPQ